MERSRTYRVSRRLALLAFVVGSIPGLACSGGGLPTSSDPEPTTGCPAAGPGVSIGGWGGGEDTVVVPLRRVVLMGGGPEDDQASTLFAEAAAGGDLLVLRATGSTTSYPDYFTYLLSPSPAPASVLTVRTDIPSAGGHESVLCRLGRAETVWLAGGDQWDYLGGWPQPLHRALATFASGGGAVGGTSAGAVSLGEAAFDAREGTVTSEEALAAPLSAPVSLSYPSFALPELGGMLVDSHFMERDREGRLLVFLARFLEEMQREEVLGVGLDEEVALVLEAGAYRVFGPQGSGIWLYRVRGPASLVSGQPLSLEGIRRYRLYPGDTGPWPPSLDQMSGAQLRVQEGVVGPASGS